MLSTFKVLIHKLLMVKIIEHFAEMALQHVSMIFRSNPRFEIQKPLPEIGSRIRSLYFLVKDKEDPKTQKILNWTDFGPYKSMDDRTLQSLAKSFSQIEVRIDQT